MTREQAPYCFSHTSTIRRAGTNTIATDCTSQCNTHYNHFSYPVYNSDCNIERRLQYDCNPRLYQSSYQPILLVEEHGYYSSREDRVSCSSSWALIRASTRAERAPFTASLTNWASQKRLLNLRNIIASNKFEESAIVYFQPSRTWYENKTHDSLWWVLAFSSIFNTIYKIIDLLQHRCSL